MSYCTLTLANSGAKVQLRCGTDLQTVTELRFGCRKACCCLCAIRVIDGAENLSSPSTSERQALIDKGKDHDVRLACQCAINGDVTILQE
jgi:ferredoxin